ncbi:MAG: ABC transporter ATP-binding protein [Defluviitaleaceae bacterium]|nr:ABC transporter ATP-binding protein [Defluviitaleaceae bacterium]
MNLEINSINKTYKNNVRANCDITISFKSGEIVALIGHNGAGKTTLLNQIIGNVRPDGGDIIFEGKSLIKNSKFARQNISMMTQLHAPLTGVTVSGAVKSILRIRGIKGNEADNYTDKILLDLDIDKYKNISGDKLSGGLRRLTSFAMATAMPQKIILLDEPTNDVDPTRRKLIWRYLKNLASNGHIVIIVTHNLLEVEQYADRYVMLDKGKVIKDGATGAEDNSTSTLIIYTDNKDILDNFNFPKILEKKYNEKDGEISMILDRDEIINCINLTLEMIKDKKISSYRLIPSSLETVYGDMINEK